MHPSIARGAIGGVQRPGRRRRRSVLRQRHRAGRGDGPRAPRRSASTPARSASRSRACARRCWARRAASGWRPRPRRSPRSRASARASGGVPRCRPGPAARSRAFTPHVLFELLGLRELVMALPEDDVGRALRLCLSSILVKFMKAGPRRRATGPRSASRAAFRRACSPTARSSSRAGWRRSSGARPPGRPAPRDARRGTRARCRSPADSGGARAVVAALRRDLRLRRPARRPLHLARAVAEEVPAARSSGARSRRSGTSRATPWREEQARWMAEIARVLRPGGHALLVVGDGVLDGRAENAPDGIAARRRGGRPRAGRARLAGAARPRPPAGGRSSASRPRREHLLLLQKS